MKTIRFKEPHTLQGELYGAGDTEEASNKSASKLVARGVAEYVEGEPQDTDAEGSYTTDTLEG